jgi:hypothetical protein
MPGHPMPRLRDIISNTGESKSEKMILIYNGFIPQQPGEEQQFIGTCSFSFSSFFLCGSESYFWFKSYRAMFKLLLRLFALFLLIYILAHFPGLIMIFIKIFQAAGALIIAGISTQPLLFAVGFVLLYGLNVSRAKS